MTSCPISRIKHGYLRSPGKMGKSVRLKRKRFYKLDGAIFSKHSRENVEATWHVNVQGAEIVRLGSLQFVVQFAKIDKEAIKDCENNRIMLLARTEDDCSSWVECLQFASQRRLEQYYQIGDTIGEGGFAIVRLGMCKETEQLRAVKTMQKQEDHAKLQGREVAIIKRVSHPNIVNTVDVFETGTEIHIVMEYMRGGMLYDAIEDDIRFEEQDVVQFMREILDGMIYLHSCGIVHRDLKPENILCTNKRPPFHVKISDFGLSSISTLNDMKQKTMLMSTMTGTPEFIAPEIARQQPYTEKVDVWALGMLCYNVIAGQLPLDESKDMISQLRGGLNITFPEEEWKCYSKLAFSFLKGVLCTDPEKRLSPLGCLVHPWLNASNLESKKTAKVGAHGRFSSLFLTQDYNASDIGLQNQMLSNYGGEKRLVHTKEAQNARKRWSAAYTAVLAFNRFKKLVYLPVSKGEDYIIAESSDEEVSFGEETEMSKWSNEFVSDEIGVAQKVIILEDNRKKQKECEGVDSGRTGLFSTMMRNLQGKKQNEGDGGRELAAESPRRANRNWLSEEIEKNDEATFTCATEKGSSVQNGIRECEATSGSLFRKKFLSTSNKLAAPVRKLSKKLTRRRDFGVKQGTALSPIAAGSWDLTLGLGDLDITEVDDQELLYLDDEAASKSVTNISGQERRKNQNDIATSPCTPGPSRGSL